MTKRPSRESVARAAAFKARVAEVSTETCPKCGKSTTTGMLASLGHCSACGLEQYAATGHANDYVETHRIEHNRIWGSPTS